MTNDFSKFQTQDLTKPRDKGWNNFAKFEQAGDKVTGILRDVFYQPAEDMYPERRGFTLENEKGEFVNVAIKRNPYFAIRATDEVRLGDLLTVELAEKRPAKQKGYKPANIFAFTAGIDPDGGNDRPTVRELEEAEMKELGVAVGNDEDDSESNSSDDVPFN